MAGKPVHIEIGARDTQRALAFYGSLFGWELQPMEGPFEYHTTRFSEDSGGAIFPSEEGPSVRVYYDVDDVHAGRARVAELGGTADEPMPVPGMGWFATCTDPDGNPFGLWQTDPSAQMPSQ